MMEEMPHRIEIHIDPCQMGGYRVYVGDPYWVVFKDTLKESLEAVLKHLEEKNDV